MRDSLPTRLSDLGRRGCECIRCLRLFWGVPAFDKHHTARRSIERRCMSDEEMFSVGLAKDARGVWTWANEIGRVRRVPPRRVASPSRKPQPVESVA